MLIGTMNHPARDVIREIEDVARMSLEFMDLTLEPPCARPGKVDAARIRSASGRTAFPLAEMMMTGGGSGSD